MATKTPTVPDIGGLLSKISAKHNELPKAPIQRIEPVAEESRKAGKTVKRQYANTAEVKTGRPSVKPAEVEYVKITPRIPKTIRAKMLVAIAEERFTQSPGKPIKTIDEFVSLALTRMLDSK